uniref:Ubiquitin carboxyl-terminal hydrolase n=1 Tax=Oncorhynchus tshawytscha TaxID=74940 RepID=A0A8C8CWM4_ONCTS
MADSGTEIVGGDLLSVVKDDCSLTEGSSLSADVPCLADDVLAGVAAAAATGGATAADLEPMMPAYYFVKWITWKEKKTPIITQSENGPCPLLAIMNTLFLRWKAKLPAQTEVITTEDLMAHLGECVLSIKPREKAEGMELNFQQNMSDAMAVLPKLSTGLDVNVRFTGVSDFEYTPECIAFDLLDIPLYHGWLVDPQSPEMVAAVGKLSYNQLVEKIIDYKHSANSSRVSEGLVAEQFLESTATQLSYHGLCELNTTVKEGELSVFFRNNHFSTMIKHKGHLYLLVTDQGFLQEGGLVWESLHNVEGDGNFCDSDFRLCHPPQRSVPVTQPEDLTPQQQQRQIDQDYLVAMSLQQQQGVAPGPLSDLDLARQLQEEEYQQQQQQQQQGGPSLAPAQQVTNHTVWAYTRRKETPL